MTQQPGWGPQQPPQPGQPPYGYPQQPGLYGTPPPPPQKKGIGVGGGIAIGCGSLLALAVVLFIIGALASSGSDSKPRTTAGNTAPTAPSTAAAAPVEAPTPSVKPEKPAEQPAADEYGDGDYIVGEDIPPGTYTTPGAEAGVFELCMVTTKPTDDSVMPQLKSANRGDRIIITLKKEDGVVSVSGCEPLKLRK